MSSDLDGTSPHEAPQEQQRLESAPGRALLKTLDRKRIFLQNPKKKTNTGGVLIIGSHFSQRPLISGLLFSK
jgi:hypothetical protein